jgi:hypothetical protein
MPRPHTRHTGLPPRGDAIAVRMFSRSGATGWSSACRQKPSVSIGWPAVNVYHVCGGVFVLWAVAVSVLGITREDFPGSAGAMRIVATVSILLAVATIGSAIYVGATEKKEEGGGEKSSHSFVQPI